LPEVEGDEEQHDDRAEDGEGRAPAKGLEQPGAPRDEDHHPESGTDVSKADGSATLRALEPARHDHGHRAEGCLSDRAQHAIVHHEVTKVLQGATRHQRPTTQEGSAGKHEAGAIAIQEPADQGCADD
jgi:hypothetical protein